MENWERNQMWNINQGVNNYPPEENKANWLERNVLELHRSFLRFKKDSEQATCYKKLTRGRLGNIQPGDNFLYDGREILRVYTLFFSFFFCLTASGILVPQPAMEPELPSSLATILGRKP